MKRIRKARPQDASRIAEILIFAKRTAYRPIFQNDAITSAVSSIKWALTAGSSTAAASPFFF